MEKDFDTYDDIKKSTDLDYLNQLIEYIDMDIENIGKDSYTIRQMKARMRNLSVEEMENQQLDEYSTLKRKVQSRISELSQPKINKNKRVYINDWFNKEQTFNEGDVLVFEMPPFCTGDYSAKIYIDNDGDAYINKDDNYYDGCRDFYIKNERV